MSQTWVSHIAGRCFIIWATREAGKVVWYSHLFLNFPQFVVIYTVKAEKAMAPHSSTLAWKIPWTEEPGRLQSMGLLRVGHDWATSLSLFTFMHWRRKWQPTPVFLPRESQGAWWAAVYGVTQSRTRLKRLSSSSSTRIWNLLFFMKGYFLSRGKEETTMFQLSSTYNKSVSLRSPS